MLQSQVNYWTLQETKRHNLATEALTGEQVQAQQLGAQASMMQAETSRMTLPFEQMKAEASQMQGVASLQNAVANTRNAATNERNAAVNEFNANVNAFNAQTNRINAAINQQNANSNALNAMTNYKVGNKQIAQMVANIDYIHEQTATQHEKTEQAKIQTQFETANQIAGLIGQGTDSIEDLTSAWNNLFGKSNGDSGLLGLIGTILSATM